MLPRRYVALVGLVACTGGTDTASSGISSSRFSSRASESGARIMLTEVSYGLRDGHIRRAISQAAWAADPDGRATGKSCALRRSRDQPGRRERNWPRPSLDANRPMPPGPPGRGTPEGMKAASRPASRTAGDGAPITA